MPTLHEMLLRSVWAHDVLKNIPCGNNQLALKTRNQESPDGGIKPLEELKAN